MDFKIFYEGYHRDRRLPKRIITNKNFTYRIVLSVLDKYCKAKDVLDVGSGVGTVDFYLAKKGKKVTGIEISENAIDIANRSSKIFGLEKSVKFRKIDFLKSELNRKYSFVMCFEVLEHLPDDKKAMQKIYKMTKNRGLVMITVPSKNAPLGNSKATKDFDKFSGHLRKYDMENAKKLLEENGFKIVFTKKIHGIITNALFVNRWNQIIRVANRFAFVSDLFIFLDNITLKLFGGSNLILVARKV